MRCVSTWSSTSSSRTRLPPLSPSLLLSLPSLSSAPSAIPDAWLAQLRNTEGCKCAAHLLVPGWVCCPLRVSSHVRHSHSVWCIAVGVWHAVRGTETAYARQCPYEDSVSVAMRGSAAAYRLRCVALTARAGEHIDHAQERARQGQGAFPRPDTSGVLRLCSPVNGCRIPLSCQRSPHNLSGTGARLYGWR